VVVVARMHVRLARLRAGGLSRREAGHVVGSAVGRIGLFGTVAVGGESRSERRGKREGTSNAKS
jgi:hypothetical protein